jgi:hypothetical protein
MASLLVALPNTQLSRRLASEGRLLNAATYEPYAPDERHEVVLPAVQGELHDQTVLGGLKFTTTRDRYQILQEHRRVWKTIYDPQRYFARVLRAARRIKARRKHKLPRREQARLDRGFLIIMGKLSRIPGVRWPLWRMLARAVFLGVSRFEHVARMAIAYHQFQKIRDRIDEKLPQRIRFEQQRGVPCACQAAAEATAD